MNTTMRAVTGFAFAGLLAPAACGQECVAFTPIASVDTPSQALVVQAVGDIVYIADYFWGGLQIFDLSDLNAPILLGAAPVGPLDFVVRDHWAFVAADINGLRIYDVGNPAEPALVGSGYAGYRANSIAVVGDLVYVTADGPQGLYIFDVSSIDAPVRLSSITLDSACQAIAVAGPLAYIAPRSRRGIRIVDVSDPSAPDWIATALAPETAGISVKDNLAYLADETGLRLIDVGNPANPQQVAFYPLDYPALDVRVVGDIAFVAASEAGVYAINVASPSAPRVVGVYDTPGSATGIDVQGDRVYVADGEAGLLVLEMTACEPCPADLNFDRRLDFYDVQLFLNYFAAGDGRADFTGDGSFAWDDVQAMLDAYASGCP